MLRPAVNVKKHKSMKNHVLIGKLWIVHSFLWVFHVFFGLLHGEVSETLLEVARQLQPNSALPFRPQTANVTLTALQAVEKLGRTVGHSMLG